MELCLLGIVLDIFVYTYQLYIYISLKIYLFLQAPFGYKSILVECFELPSLSKYSLDCGSLLLWAQWILELDRSHSQQRETIDCSMIKRKEDTTSNSKRPISHTKRRTSHSKRPRSSEVSSKGGCQQQERNLRPDHGSWKTDINKCSNDDIMLMRKQQ